VQGVEKWALPPLVWRSERHGIDHLEVANAPRLATMP
jgi:hypothetical protein